MKKRYYNILFILVFCIMSLHLYAQNNFTSFSEIDMIKLAQNAKNNSFIIGENNQTYTAKREVSPFQINKYETTYNLWYKIRIEAQKRGYVFANPGQEGSFGKRGKEPTEENKMHPVTMINWYDAIVWCNALSEIQNKTPCYTYNNKVLRDSTDTASCDLAVCDWNANGYRLPTETEWEYAARFTKNGMQSGDLASGQITSDYDLDRVAWIYDNSNKTHIVGTAGSVFTDDAIPSIGSGNGNGAGLFDMSGNVLEFCWDWFSDYEKQSATFEVGPKYGNERICRGGSYSEYTLFFNAGDRYSFDPNELYNYMGFRIVSK